MEYGISPDLVTEMNKGTTDRLEWQSLLGAMLCFAGVPLFVKYFAGFLDAWTVNAVRYATATAFWLPYLLFARRAAGSSASFPWKLAIVPAALNTVGQVGWALCPYFNDAAFIGFVTRSSFFFTTIAGFLMLPQERSLLRRPMFWIGAIAITGGLVGMYAQGVRHGVTSPAGMAILLGTAACWGLYGVSVKRFVSGYSARLSFGIISTYTTCVLVLLMFLFGEWRDLAAVRLPQWGLLLLSGFLGIAFSHVLLYRTIRSFGAIVTEGVMSLQPFLTAIGAVFFLGERPGWEQWIGGVTLAMGCLSLVRCRMYLVGPDRNQDR